MQTPRRRFLLGAAAGAALPLLPGSQVEAAPPSISYDPKAMGAPKFIDVNGVRTRYYEGGSGEALVLIHGGQWPAITSADSWAPIFPLLAQRFHVYAFDKLGMGYTDNPKSDADYSMDAICDHAYGFIRAINVSRAALCGHSRGALPAARVAVDHPDLISHLVILDTNALGSDDIKLSDRPDPPPIKQVPTVEQIRKADLASPLYYNKNFATDAFVEAEHRIAALPKIKEVDEKFRALRDAWIRANPEKMKENPALGNNMGSVVWWMIDCKHETLRRIEAGRLKAPTTFVWGWNDPFAPYSLGLSAMTRIAKVVPRTEMHLVNRASHFVYIDQPQETARLIVSFVES